MLAWGPCLAAGKAIVNRRPRVLRPRGALNIATCKGHDIEAAAAAPVPPPAPQQHQHQQRQSSGAPPPDAAPHGAHGQPQLPALLRNLWAQLVTHWSSLTGAVGIAVPLSLAGSPI